MAWDNASVTRASGPCTGPCYRKSPMPATKPPSRQFVPETLDVSKWDEVEPLYFPLRERPIDSPTALERWLLDFSELTSVIEEYGTRRYIDKSCHTDDQEIVSRFMFYIEQIEPKVKPHA